MTFKSSLHLTFALAAVLTVACGSDKPTSPASPSASTPAAAAPAPPTAGAVSGATISGVVVGAAGITSANRVLSVTGMTVTVSGSSASSPVDGSGQFVLRGVPSGHVDLHFSGGGNDAHLGLDDVADHEDIHLTVHVNGSTADMDNDDRDDHGNLEVEGVVTQVGGGTLRIGDTVVTVPAGIVIRHDGTTMTLTDIHVGDRVHVHGTGTRTAVTATRIEVQRSISGLPAPTPTRPPGDDDHDEAEVNGAVSGLRGACPAITFTVASTTVVTSAATEFKDTTCAAVVNGTTVEAKGSRSGSTLTAKRVEKKK